MMELRRVIGCCGSGVALSCCRVRNRLVYLGVAMRELRCEIGLLRY